MPDIVNDDNINPEQHHKTVSPRQLAANRANAQKSTGPQTPQGKVAVRFNGLTHGLTATVVCIPGEDPEQYQALRLEFHRIFQPRNLFEHGLVNAIAAAHWREIRYVGAENGVIRGQFADQRADLETRYNALSLDAEAVLAIKAVADTSSAFDHLDRHERRIRRNSASAMRQLADYRRNFPPAESPNYSPAWAENANLQTKAIPENEHPEPAPAPIGNATAPHTIVLKQEPIAEKAMAAGASAPDWPLIISHGGSASGELATADYSQLITHNAQLT